MEYLQANMSPGVFPFFNAELELELPEMVFSPSLNKDVHGGFYDLVESLISDIYKKASIMQRVSGEESYQAIMESHDDLNVIRNDIMNRVVSVMDAATQFRPVFLYRYFFKPRISNVRIDSFHYWHQLKNL